MSIIFSDWLISLFFTLSGGKILTTFSAALIVNKLLSISFFMNFVWSALSCIPINKPLPLISLIILGYSSLILLRLDRKCSEIFLTFFKNLLFEKTIINIAYGISYTIKKIC